MKVVEFLVQQGFDWNLGNNKGRTGFHLACLYGSLNVVQLLVQKGFDMNVGTNKGSTGFHFACLYENLNVVQFLVQKGFDMNIGNNKGSTGFHLACVYGNLKIVQFLVQQGFNMNISDDSGSTGFHLACVKGHLYVVQFLLEQGFDTNLCNDDGASGFHLACLKGNLNMIQFLLRGFHGINKRVFMNMTGLEILIKKRYNYSGVERFMPCILLLIEAGAELNNNYIFEKLISAIQNRIIEITFMKETIFEKWTVRIAQTIIDFTMDPFTNASLENLSQFLE